MAAMRTAGAAGGSTDDVHRIPSDDADVLSVALTGFGPFHGVPRNPTTVLVERLAAAATDKFQVTVAEVLEVSAAGSTAQLRDLHALASGSTQRPLLWLHLGVSSRAVAFTLETVGYNWHDFRCPDERGYQPKGVSIAADGPPALRTSIDVDGAIKLLRDAGCVEPVVSSQDPGRFICNHVYYEALAALRCSGGAAARRAAVLFVHVPPFDVVPADRQKAFVTDLLRVLSTGWTSVVNSNGPQPDVERKAVVETFVKTIGTAGPVPPSKDDNTRGGGGADAVRAARVAAGLAKKREAEERRRLARAARDAEKAAAKATKAKEREAKAAAARRRRAEATTVGVDVEWNVAGAPVPLDLWRAPGRTKDAAAAAAGAGAALSECQHEPLLLWIHGGGWRHGDHHMMPAFMKHLVLREGFAVASVGYRKAAASFPACIHDCKAAVRWLRAHGAAARGLDATRLGVVGSSSGGHLALLLGLTSGVDALEGASLGCGDCSSAVQAVVAFAPPTDLSRGKGAHALRDAKLPEARLLGAPLADVPELVALASPMTHAQACAEEEAVAASATEKATRRRRCPPLLLLHGTEDQVVPLSQSEALHRVLDPSTSAKTSSTGCTLYPVPGGRHLRFGLMDRPLSADDQERWSPAFDVAGAFLQQHLWEGSQPQQPGQPQSHNSEAAANSSASSSSSPAIERAAAALLRADFVLVTAGAGFSADSGLKVYKDIADVPAYRSLGLDYGDLCEPSWLDRDPGLFFGFWGGCWNAYHDTVPHAGYAILRKWQRAKQEIRRQREEQKQEHEQELELPTPMYVYTSNVDAHFLRAGFRREDVYEIHGNVDEWQCAAGARTGLLGHAPCRGVDAKPFALPVSNGRQRFAVDPTTMRTTPTGEENDAEKKDVTRGGNWIRVSCPVCGGPSRPRVLMFRDDHWIKTKTQEASYVDWEERVEACVSPSASTASAPEATTASGAAGEAGPRRKRSLVVLELGCGERVPHVRREGEMVVEDILRSSGASAAGAPAFSSATLIRVNPSPSEAGYTPINENSSHVVPGVDTVSIVDTALKALLAIDDVMGDSRHCQGMEDKPATASALVAGKEEAKVKETKDGTSSAGEPPAPTVEEPEQQEKEIDIVALKAQHVEELERVRAEVKQASEARREQDLSDAREVAEAERALFLEALNAGVYDNLLRRAASGTFNQMENEWEFVGESDTAEETARAARQEWQHHLDAMQNDGQQVPLLPAEVRLRCLVVVLGEMGLDDPEECEEDDEAVECAKQCVAAMLPVEEVPPDAWARARPEHLEEDEWSVCCEYLLR